MNYLVLIIMMICVAGIIYFSRQITPGKRTRLEYLKELEAFLESKAEVMRKNSRDYRIPFHFEKYPFVYEDRLSPGFKGVINQTCVIGQTQSQLTLYFTEKERKNFLQLTVEENSSASQEKQVKLPKSFHQFSVHTNDTSTANDLLQDAAVMRIFTEFKNTDHQGRPVVTLSVRQGAVILDFHPSARCHPKPLSELASFDPLEDYLDKMIVLIKKLNQMP